MTAPRWDSDKRFVVVALADAYAKMMWSEEFRTEDAAQKAAQFVKQYCARVTIIED